MTLSRLTQNPFHLHRPLVQRALLPRDPFRLHRPLVQQALLHPLRSLHQSNAGPGPGLNLGVAVLSLQPSLCHLQLSHSP